MIYGIHNPFAYIYSHIQRKHPDWSKARIRSCTIYAMKYSSKGRKVNEQT